MAGAGRELMQVEVAGSAEAAALRAAGLIAERLELAIAARGAASLALSGGRTPARLFRALVDSSADWSRIQVLQVDERVIGEDDERSNMKTIRAAFGPVVPDRNLHAMPVTSGPPEAAAARYAETLRALAGSPPVLDVVHLGLGADGHTASLVPGDAAVDAAGDVVAAGVYEGLRRLSLTLATLNRARCRVWLVTGSGKRAAVGRLLGRDPELVASRIRREGTVLVLDHDAAPAAA